MNLSRPYPAPVERLMQLGQCRTEHVWRNYLDLGLTPEHVPYLIECLQDTTLAFGEADNPEAWKTFHAWRALGQLRAEAAIEPLIDLFDELQDDLTFIGEAPDVFRRIGPAAIPALTAYLADTEHDGPARLIALNALDQIAEEYLDVRARCLSILVQQLRNYHDNGDDINGAIIAALTYYDYVEAAPLMQEVFDAGYIDEELDGTWEETEIALGLAPEPPPLDLLDLLSPPPPLLFPTRPFMAPPSGGQKAKSRGITVPSSQKKKPKKRK